MLLCNVVEDTLLRWNISWHVDVRFVEKEQWPVTWLPERDSRRRRVVSVSISVSQQREFSDRISSQSRQWSTELRQQSRSVQDASGPVGSRRLSDSISFSTEEKEKSPDRDFFFNFGDQSHDSHCRQVPDCKHRAAAYSEKPLHVSEIRGGHVAWDISLNCSREATALDSACTSSFQE